MGSVVPTDSPPDDKLISIDGVIIGCVVGGLVLLLVLVICVVVICMRRRNSSSYEIKVLPLRNGEQN